MGTGGPANRRSDRSRPRRVRENRLGRAGARPLCVDGGPAPRARRRRSRAHPRGAVRPRNGPQSEHRAAGLAEDLRSASRRLQPRQRLEPSGRSRAGEDAAAGTPGLHRGVKAAGRARTRAEPARPDPRLSGAARRAGRGADPPRRGLRTRGGRPRSAAPRHGLPDRPRSGHRQAVAAERSAV